MVTQERPRVRNVESWRPRPTLSGTDYKSFNERWRLAMGRPLVG